MLNHLFYGQKTLKNYSYVLKLDKTVMCKHLEISNKIFHLGGVKITFRISSQSIIIVDNLSHLLKVESETILKGFDRAFIHNQGEFKYLLIKDPAKIINIPQNTEANDYINFFPSKVERVINDKGIDQNSLRIITLGDMEKILNELEPYSIDYHYKLGLPSNTDPNSVISLIQSNNFEKKMNYHIFQKMKTNKNDLNMNKKCENIINFSIKYDFPKFVKESKDGYSLFLTNAEKITIDNFKKTNSNIDISRNEGNQINTQIPRINNNFCYICKFKFQNYKEHCSSNLHQKNSIALNASFDNINMIFSDIRESWVETNNTNKSKPFPTSCNENGQTENKLSEVKGLVSIKRVKKTKKKSLIELGYNYKTRANLKLKGIFPVKLIRFTRSNTYKCKSFNFIKKLLSNQDGLRYFMNYKTLSNQKKHFL